MAIPNKVSAELKDESVQEVKHRITEILDRLPFLIDLSPEEKLKLPKYGTKDVQFIRNCYETGIQNEGILPRHLDMNEVAKDIQLLDRLNEILIPLTTLYEKVLDTYKETGAEAYAAALLIYNHLKINGKAVGGLDDLLSGLSRHFARKASKPPATS